MGNKNPIIAQNKFKVLEDILDGSYMDYGYLEDLDHGPSGTLSK
jgi:hypothetical protein